MNIKDREIRRVERFRKAIGEGVPLKDLADPSCSCKGVGIRRIEPRGLQRCKCTQPYYNELH